MTPNHHLSDAQQRSAAFGAAKLRMFGRSLRFSSQTTLLDVLARAKESMSRAELQELQRALIAGQVNMLQRIGS